ncbi:hypothetical protein N9W20_01545 [Candidatus Pelagibacter bacterium]|nr:hypothetical protein [Candidatus Pelagibacter bacterium]
MEIKSKSAEILAKAKKQEDVADAEQVLEGRKLKTTAKVDLVINSANNISPVEERLISNDVELNDVSYDHDDRVVAKVRQDNVNKFYKQINHNLIIGAKAMYLVCRDLKIAQQKLGDDFKVLTESLNLSDSTVSKYVKIAKSNLCTKLYIENRLPDNWTTMYEFAKIDNPISGAANKDHVKMVYEQSTVKSTLEDMKGWLNIISDSIKKMFNFDLEKPKQFLSIAVDNNSSVNNIDPNALLMISNAVKKTVDEQVKNYQSTIDYKADLWGTSPMKFDVAVNDKAIESSRNKVLQMFEGEKYKEYLDSFYSLFKRLSAVSK